MTDKPVVEPSVQAFVERLEFASERIAELEARLASQELALGVAVGALREVEHQAASYPGLDNHVFTLFSGIANRALTQIEGEGEKL